MDSYDASIMPTIGTADTNATVPVIAGRAATLIRGRRDSERDA